MKTLAQPESYSGILQRIFLFSITTGIICTFLLANSSPIVNTIIHSLKTKVNYGPLKNIEILYLLIPLIIALVSRIIKLHDRISDVFRIRATIDTKFILIPLCERSGVALTPRLKKAIKKNRKKYMYKTFYPYASFLNPSISKQLVRTAADNWGWFWALLESSFIFSLTILLSLYLDTPVYIRLLLIILLGEILLMWYLWRSAMRYAIHQVEEILKISSNKQAVKNFFSNL